MKNRKLVIFLILAAIYITVAGLSLIDSYVGENFSDDAALGQLEDAGGSEKLNRIHGYQEKWNAAGPIVLIVIFFLMFRKEIWQRYQLKKYENENHDDPFADVKSIEQEDKS